MRIEAFSLTLTLSRWERGQPSHARCFSEARRAITVSLPSRKREQTFDTRIIRSVQSLLPLPAGEGRGEGERVNNSTSNNYL